MRFPVPPPVLAALARLSEGGYQSYLVGGCVRDDLLGIPPHDYDIATSATPEQTAACFEGAHLLLSGRRHGTVTPILDGIPVEITTFRRDGAYSDGRHPDAVAFSTRLEDDVTRRDFTINAMAWSPGTGLVDLVGGARDCRSRLLRAVGAPRRRFEEDALRMLRAVRFASALGFAVEDATAQAMAACAPLLSRVSVERVAAEWSGALLGADVPAIAAHPEVLSAAVRELEQVYPGRLSDGVRAAAHVAAALPADLPMRWAAMFAGGDPRVTAPAAEAAAGRLRLSNRLRQDIGLLASHAHTPLADGDAGMWLSQLGLPMLRRVIALQQGRARDEAEKARLDRVLALAEQAARDGACQTLRDLAINGHDLLAAGFAKGPAIGLVLGALLKKVVRGRLPNERGALLAAARAMREEAQTS